MSKDINGIAKVMREILADKTVSKVQIESGGFGLYVSRDVPIGNERTHLIGFDCSSAVTDDSCDD